MSLGSSRLTPRAPRIPLRLLAGLALTALSLGGVATPVHAGDVPTARDHAIVQAMKTKRVGKVDFKEKSLKDFATWLRVVTGWNVLVSQTALAKASIDPAAVTFSVELDNVTVARCSTCSCRPWRWA